MEPKQNQKPFYLLRKELGRGEFGIVYKARQIPTGKKVAAKQITKKGNAWKKEVAILKKISSRKTHVSEFADRPFQDDY